MSNTSNKNPDSNPDIAEQEVSECSTDVDGEYWRYCARCGHELHNHKCKLVCARCGYFMSCSDFD